MFRQRGKMAAALMSHPASLKAQIALILLSSIPSLAQSPAKKDAGDRDFSKEGVVIEQMTTRVVFQSDGTYTYYQHARVRVQSDAGVRQYGILPFSYQASVGRVEVQNVRVTKPNATWTKAGKVRRAFKAGRPRQKNRIVSPTVAIHEACILLHELRGAMHAEGLLENDVQAALVIVTPETPDRENFVYLQVIPDPKRLPDLFASVRKIEKPEKMFIMGILLKQRDRELGKDVVWPHHYLIGESAQKAMRKAGEMFQELERGSGGKAAFN
jgi:hypothetical protein